MTEMMKLVVPLSQSQALGQRDRAIIQRVNGGTGTGRISIKALASKVLQRDRARDNRGTSPRESVPTSITAAGQLEHVPKIDEERAALVEYEAGVPREWAEGFATLCAMPRPPCIPPKEWQRLIDNAGVFLDRFAVQAASLGWTTESVFGCHPEAPLARLDAAGLAFLIGDGEIVAITASTAMIRRLVGTLTYSRRETRPDERQVAVWQLS